MSGEPDLATQVKALAARVHELEQVRALHELRNRLPRLINDDAWGRVGELFTEHAHLDYGEVGRADFVVEQAMVVQVRAVDTLDDLHRMQAQAVVRLSGQRLGLLINFNVFPVVKGVHRIGAKP